MNLKLQQLYHFTLVAEEKGFRNAASRANRSQAAISSSIKELERSLGQALFEHGNKARLTPFGKACLPRVQNMLIQADQLETDLFALARGEKGRIRVASIPSVASRLLPAVLAEFSAHYPDVEVELEDDTAERVEARLLRGEVDIALGNQVKESAVPKENSLAKKSHRVDFKLLLHDPIGVVCSRHHPLTQLYRPIHWKDLKQHNRIYNGTVRLLRNTPLHDLMEDARYRVSNMMSLYSMLEQGLGVTTLPQLATSAAHSELVWLPLKSPKLERAIGIQQLTDRTLSPQAQSFYDMCCYMLFDE
ncbi:LysR family transcriptional regulator [Oceanospirillum sediminis]|uniref:LysR family transcriptional regulator n=1 Tax=Oceanospirillum sediminis TaxID=2760088 RepID=A0A839IWD2_9GAMM|nr:LysR family transcriptional regulator [Oceanospirillum sediminis]MBB1489268.1 LysR family transcriptional regulator [Oceanospirillum sediminis]